MNEVYEAFMLGGQEIERLRKENKKLKEELQRKDNIIKDYEQKIQDNNSDISNLTYQLAKKNDNWNELKDIINRMIYMGYCAKTGKGTTATNFMATGENSEFGTRALYILDKIKDIENDK